MARKIRVGMDVYKVCVWDEDDGTIKTELETHRVSVIRKEVAFLIHKNKFTWGKRSRKTGDYGWLRDFITNDDRNQFTIGKRLPHGMSYTKRGAYTKAISTHLRYWPEAVPRLRTARKRLIGRGNKKIAED